MAQEIRTGIKLTGDASGMTAAFKSGERAVTDLDDKVSKTGKATRGLTTEMGGLASGVAKVAAAVGGWQLGGAIIRAADDMTVLQSRLKLVTDSAAQQSFVQRRLFEIAQDARIGYGALAQQYAQTARSSQELQVSQTRLLAVNQTIAQAMAIGGGEATAMNAAMTQLSQGLASGTLRGEELNSILEQTPRLAQAIAQGMGISIGQLRAYGQEGKLTALAVIEALEKSAQSVQREFAVMTPTVSGAFQTLKNSGALFISEMDKATGASAMLATGLTATAKAVAALGSEMADHKDTITVLANGAVWAVGLGAAAVGLGKVALGVRAIGLALAANPAIAAIMLGGAVVGAWSQWGDNKDNSLEGMKSRLKGMERDVNLRSIYDERTPESNARFAQEVEKRKQAIATLKAAIEDAEGTSRNRRTFLEFERGQEASTASTLMFPGAKPIDDVRKHAQLAVDIQRDAYDKSVEIAKAYQNRIAQATSEDDRVALTQEMNARLVAVDRDAKAELAALAKQGTQTAAQAAQDARQLAEAQATENKARLGLAAAFERQNLAERTRNLEQFHRLGLLSDEEYGQRKAELASEEIDISARLLGAELAQAKALAASAGGAKDKASAQAKVLEIERELVELATQRQAVQAQPGLDAEAARMERENQAIAAAWAARAAQTRQAYADMARMESDTQRLNAGQIRDPRARAQALLDLELQAQRQRIALIANDNTREEAIERFNDFALAKQLELNERLKPAWQQMLDGWNDSAQLMRETYDDTITGMLQDGEQAFIRSSGNLVSVANSMVDQLKQQLLRLVYRQTIGNMVESAGSYLTSALLKAFGGGAASSASSMYSLTSGSGSMGLQMRASGGSYGPGLVLRGEHGPELSWENSSGYVFNASETRQMLTGGGAAQNVTVKLINESGTQLQATQGQTSRAADGGLQVEVLVQAMEARMADNLAARSGPMARALESGWGLRPAMA